MLTRHSRRRLKLFGIFLLLALAFGFAEDMLAIWISGGTFSAKTVGMVVAMSIVFAFVSEMITNHVITEGGCTSTIRHHISHKHLIGVNGNTHRRYRR